MREEVFKRLLSHFCFEERKSEKLSATEASALKAKIAYQKREFVEDLQEFLQIDNKSMDKFIETVKRDVEIDHAGFDIPLPELAAFTIEPRKGGEIVRRASPRLQRHEYMIKLGELSNCEEIYQYILTLWNSVHTT